MQYDLRSIGSRFSIYGDFVAGEGCGAGHINDTFALTFDQDGRSVRYILQRINQHIFKDPSLLMENIMRVTEHQRSKNAGLDDALRRSLTFILCRDGRPFVMDDDGNYWRAYSFIENVMTYDAVESEKQAYEAARTFGRFQKDLTDLPGERLHETISDFHNTPKRYDALHQAIKDDCVNRVASARAEIEYVLKCEEWASVLIDKQRAGVIPERITHNDTKLNNVLLDVDTGEGMCVIDLDTVMPGLALYDFGDMVRTATSPADEDERDLSKVKMQMGMFRALVDGYLSTAGDFLVSAEKEHLVFSGKLITLEIGVRFLTDYLVGDTYFKVHRDGHNLDRCRTQFELVRSIEGREDQMSAYVMEREG
ncbi:MAG: aminoglycoside phosphotransferase family protein [Kiritimatiellae bacterium]|nr:aminoglycoside phosphotransferase family protein [Kiritimatiellia bacterium]